MAVATEAWPLGSLLDDRYVRLSLLGRGAMGAVFLARDIVLEREVAIKVLRTGASARDEARFRAEVKALAALRHGHVVALFDAGLDGGVPYLVMEYVPGRTLAALLADGPVPDERIRALGSQIAAALADVHAQAMVHRDVKPSNILVHEDGRAFLSDFGVARLLETDVSTRSDEVIGSPAYLAPEQVSGRTVGSAADVYSLGLVLLEALTGQRVYTGTPTEAAVARLHASPMIPTSVGPAWSGLLDRMTRLHPDERPTAAEVALILGASAPIADEAAATGTLLLDDLPVPPRRNRVGRAAVLALASAVVVGLGALVALPFKVADEPASGPWSVQVALDHVDGVLAEIAALPDPIAETAPPAVAKPAAPPADGSPGKGGDKGKGGKGGGKGGKG